MLQEFPATVARCSARLIGCLVLGLLLAGTSARVETAEVMSLPPTAMPATTLAPSPTPGPTATLGPIVTLSPTATLGPSALPATEVLAPPRRVEEVFWHDEVPPLLNPFLPMWKPEWIEQIRFSSSWIPGQTGSTFGDTNYGADATFEVPWTVLGSPWYITPHFTGHILYGPEVTDVPGHWFDTWVEFGRRYRLGERWELETAYAPSIFSDFNNSRSDAFRVTGRVVGAWCWTPRFKIVAGATYLGRRDIPLLPVAGVVWLPNDRFELEAVFPRPRVLGRIPLPPSIERLLSLPISEAFGIRQTDEFWGYISGELGGNSYAIRRADGSQDALTYKDLRLSVGYEHRGVLGFTNRSEIGWVFDRSLDYASAPGRVRLADSFLFRSEYLY